MAESAQQIKNAVCPDFSGRVMCWAADYRCATSGVISGNSWGQLADGSSPSLLTNPHGLFYCFVRWRTNSLWNMLAFIHHAIRISALLVRVWRRGGWLQCCWESLDTQNRNLWIRGL